jgi:flagellin-like protein
MKLRIRKEKGVSPVIAVILMLAITVVLAAAAWLMVSGMIGRLDVPPTYINLTLESEQQNSSQRIIHVAGMEKTFNLGNFKVGLIINNSEISMMDPLINATVGNITFADINGDGNLNVGDDFFISIVRNTHYEIKIFWKANGNQVCTFDWDEV